MEISAIMKQKILFLIMFPLLCRCQQIFDPFASSNNNPGTGRRVSSQRLGATGQTVTPSFQPSREPPNYGISPPTYHSSRPIENYGPDTIRPFLTQPVLANRFPSSGYNPGASFTPQLTGYVNTGGISYNLPSTGQYNDFTNQRLLSQRVPQTFANLPNNGQTSPQYQYQRESLMQQQGQTGGNYQSGFYNQQRRPQYGLDRNFVQPNERDNTLNSGNAYDQSSEYQVVRNYRSQQAQFAGTETAGRAPPVQIRQSFQEIVDGY